MGLAAGHSGLRPVPSHPRPFAVGTSSRSNRAGAVGWGETPIGVTGPVRQARKMLLRCLPKFLLLVSVLSSRTESVADDYTRLPAKGDFSLLIVSPEEIEIRHINSKEADGPVVDWDFVDAEGALRLPGAGDMVVSADGQPVAVGEIGFKRRVVYAPLLVRDLRIGNHLYLRLKTPLATGQVVEVKNPSGVLWGKDTRLLATNDSQRLSEAIHVNQAGYQPQDYKVAMVGLYLGSRGELEVPGADAFRLLTSDGRREVFQGPLTVRRDQGFPFPCYQQVLAADFSAFTNAGEYRLSVAGLGVSYPFRIDAGYPALLARTYALGIYHQRCGHSNSLPFTRFVHAACHREMAEVPTAQFVKSQAFLLQDSADATNNPRHTAPPLKDFASSLYPFVRQGKIDVSGGHHDAGDYSKYTINSAGFIHQLVFAVDAFPGAGELDNLGLPESGDGLSDLLQEANMEAAFLSKMQDDDGGFYFLVYPRERRYEHNVPPEQGDPQIVWPKTTAVTAAAVAALAQIGSSPLFRKQFPETAGAYVAQAKQGWQFLERAIALHGKDGSYQKITHYGNDFMHDDELAWAACEMYLATGDASYHQKFREWYRPEDPATRKWGWWRLYDGFGNAARSYAFARKSGRLRPEQINSLMAARCANEVARAAEDQMLRSRQSAYGTSFPVETKRVRAAGWYFSSGAAFDLAVGCQLDYPEKRDLRPRLLEALLANFSYELGCNPVNVCYVTGLGFNTPQEIVHQFAQTDRRVLPPGGIPIGNLQGGFGWLDLYKQELGAMTFPPDGSGSHPYPIYDRWGDSFNVQTEFVIVDQARALAAASFLMGRTEFKRQPWKAATGQILITGDGGPGGAAARLVAPDVDLAAARIVWETPSTGVSHSTVLTLEGNRPTSGWIEAEALLPDGRRIVGAINPVSGPKVR